MRNRIALAALALGLAFPTTAWAQQKATGRYFFATDWADTTALADGGMLERFGNKQVTYADAPGNPLDNMYAVCSGSTMVGKDQKPVSSSGSCMARDMAGNGASFWWRLTEAGSEKCPISCGVWGYSGGFGKLAGIGGGGTWKTTAVFPDGAGMGTWDGTHTMK